MPLPMSGLKFVWGICTYIILMYFICRDQGFHPAITFLFLFSTTFILVAAKVVKNDWRKK
jgi:uncharacterized membrane protein